MNFANALAGPLTKTGIPALVRRFKAKERVTILVYHDPSPEVFDRHLGWLRKYYSIVCIDDAIAALSEDKVTNLGEYPLVLTIDDGHIGNASLLPVIRKHGVRPCIYLCSALVATRRAISDYFISQHYPELRQEFKAQGNAGRRDMFRRLFGLEIESELESPMTLTAEQIGQLAPYVDFGSHGRFHQSMPNLSSDELMEELVNSKREIEAISGKLCRHFSFPTGLYDDRCVQAVRDAGYLSARITDVGWNRGRKDVFTLKVTGASDDASVRKLNIQTSGIYRFIRQCLSN